MCLKASLEFVTFFIKAPRGRKNAHFVHGSLDGRLISTLF